MKSLKSRWTEKGLKTLLVLVAVLGLVSLIGCSNTSGENANTGNGENAFLGKWTGTVLISGINQPQEWEFKTDGTCIYSIMSVHDIPPTTMNFKYTISGNIATISANGVPIYSATLSSDNKSFTFNVEVDGVPTSTFATAFTKKS